MTTDKLQCYMFVMTTDRFQQDMLWLLTTCNMILVIFCGYWPIAGCYEKYIVTVDKLECDMTIDRFQLQMNTVCVCVCVTLILLLSRFTNIGDVGNSPYFEDGKLKLKYEGGAICLDPQGPNHMSTVITFECDHNTVRTVNRYYFWMWPQHGMHCQLLLLSNVTVMSLLRGWLGFTNITPGTTMEWVT